MKPTLFALIFLFSLSYGQVENNANESDSLRHLYDEIESLKMRNESVDEIMLEMKSYIDLSRKMKITGYAHTQFQSSSGIGNGQFPIGNFAGGSFPANVGSRFQVRRGRLKVQYENELTFSQYVLQLDLTQNGAGIKDAFVNIKDPWKRDWNLKMGVFDRPFGFEVAYTSNFRETPERSRMSQTLFPGEREIGAMIEFQPEFEPWSNYNLKLGVFNGVLPTGNENDNRKDIIGRAGIIIPFEEINFAMDGGVSVYYGSVRSNSDSVYRFNGALVGFALDANTRNIGTSFDRRYVGADVQIIYDIPSLGGISLRGEYITGEQPGTASANSFYNPSAKTHLYRRNFYGYYVSLLQNIGKQHQVIVRYDVLDPNSDIDGSAIGAAGTVTTVGDIAFATIGAGYLYHFDDNVKFVFYYEMPNNEKINPSAAGALAAYTGDVNDNVFTFRIQYRFPF